MAIRVHPRNLWENKILIRIAKFMSIRVPTHNNPNTILFRYFYLFPSG